MYVVSDECVLWMCSSCECGVYECVCVYMLCMSMVCVCSVCCGCECGVLWCVCLCRFVILEHCVSSFVSEAFRTVKVLTVKTFRALTLSRSMACSV